MIKSVRLLCLGVAVTLASANLVAQENIINNKTSNSNFNNQQAHCQNIPFYREVNAAHPKVDFNAPIDPVFSSPHYCISDINTSAEHRNQLPTTLDDGQARQMFARYNYVWEQLADDQEKTAFAHLFLQALSHEMVVIPTFAIQNKITIMVPAEVKKGHVTFVQHDLSVRVTEADQWPIYQGLLALAKLSAREVDEQLKPWHKLDKQVKWAIRGDSANADLTESPIMTLENIPGSSGCTTIYAPCHSADVSLYDWQRMVEDWERPQCDISGCHYWWEDSDDYDERCLTIEYSGPEGVTTITGNYCWVF